VSSYELRFLAISRLCFFSQVQDVVVVIPFFYKTLSRYRGEGAGVGGGDPYEEVYSNTGVGSPISPDCRGPKVLLFLSGILYETFFTFEGTKDC
jgi:hypothetical protein